MTTTTTETTTFRALGFCGADDSVHPNLLGILSNSYPLVEWGVLFRPDKEGQPRYASAAWVQELGKVSSKMNGRMKLAAHLCASRVNDLLDGNKANKNGGQDFLSSLQDLGFRRVQINATAVNGVDTSRLGESVSTFLETVSKFPELEFILQKNEETRPLWEGLLKETDGSVPKNVTMLVDESKGTGMAATSWPSPPDNYEIGYAGGIGPGNIRKVLEDVSRAAPGRSIWIDMESSLRSIKNDKDVFDLEKCYEVIDAACERGIMAHPSFLA